MVDTTVPPPTVPAEHCAWVTPLYTVYSSTSDSGLPPAFGVLEVSPVTAYRICRLPELVTSMGMYSMSPGAMLLTLFSTRLRGCPLVPAAPSSEICTSPVVNWTFAVPESVNQAPVESWPIPMNARPQMVAVAARRRRRARSVGVLGLLPSYSSSRSSMGSLLQSRRAGGGRREFHACYRIDPGPGLLEAVVRYPGDGATVDPHPLNG